MKKRFRVFAFSSHAEQTCHAELVSASSETLKRVQGDVTRVRRAFTLAEVLITLMVIGVVAVLTIPAMMTNIKEQILNGQRKTANAKLLEGFRQMRVDGKLMEKYASTDAFVDEMQKYFKIATVCKGNDIYNCFTGSYTSNSIFDTTEQSITLTGKKNPADINNTYASKYSDFVGLKFADGVSMIIAVKPNCEGPAEGDSAGRSNVSELAKCFVYYYDVNGEQSPNAKGKDIIANIGAAGEDAISIGKPAPMTKAECEAFTAEHPDLNSFGCYMDNDYWIGAVKACYDRGLRLPTENELLTLMQKLYKTDCSQVYCNVSQDNIDADLLKTLSGFELTSYQVFSFWTSNNSYRQFGTNYSYLSETSRDNFYAALATFNTLCLR